jgi:uncharacterized damage-inducible protein DinB
MAWANDKVYTAAESLPDEALGAYIVNSEWTAGQILEHIVGGATWYVHRLTGEPWTDIPFPKSAADIPNLKKMLAGFDAQILGCLAEGEGTVVEEINGKEVIRKRSTVLSQAIHHATEHRAQLIDALEYKGFPIINLDSIDLWSYESAVG